MAIGDFVFFISAIAFNVSTYRLFTARETIVTDRRKYFILAGVAFGLLVAFGLNKEDLLLFVLFGSIAILVQSFLTNLLVSRLEQGQLTGNNLLAPRSFLKGFLVPIFHIVFIAFLVILFVLAVIDALSLR